MTLRSARFDSPRRSTSLTRRPHPSCAPGSTFATADDELLSAELADRVAELLVFSLLLSLPRVDTPAAPPAPRHLTRRHVRQAIEYLETSAGRANLRLTEVAAAVGVSVRALQLGFRASVGCSPMAFLRAQRLRRARVLLETREDLSISRIALECGFAHLGRFSVQYRKFYGESPSATQAALRGRGRRS